MPPLSLWIHNWSMMDINYWSIMDLHYGCLIDPLWILPFSSGITLGCLCLDPFWCSIEWLPENENNFSSKPLNIRHKIMIFLISFCFFSVQILTKIGVEFYHFLWFQIWWIWMWNPSWVLQLKEVGDLREKKRNLQNEHIPFSLSPNLWIESVAENNSKFARDHLRSL